MVIPETSGPGVQLTSSPCCYLFSQACTEASDYLVFVFGSWLSIVDAHFHPGNKRRRSRFPREDGSMRRPRPHY
jgi:hypothetical protein